MNAISNSYIGKRFFLLAKQSHKALFYWIKSIIIGRDVTNDYIAL